MQSSYFLIEFTVDFMQKASRIQLWAIYKFVTTDKKKVEQPELSKNSATSRIYHGGIPKKELLHRYISKINCFLPVYAS